MIRMIVVVALLGAGCSPTALELQSEQEEGINHAREGAPFDTSEPIGEVSSALQWQYVTITADVNSPTGWGIFGTGNPGPDAEGCQRLPWRNDCIRVQHTLSASFNNEIAYPNRIAGEQYPDGNFIHEIDVDAPSYCSTVPATVDHIVVQFSAYSSGGSQGTPNKVDVVVEEPGYVFNQFCTGCGPTSNGSNAWITFPTVYHNSSGGPIPKSAICGTASQRWKFQLVARDSRDFPNKAWDTSDWIAVGDVVIAAYF